MEIKKIVVHCSASPQGRGDDAETIHRWHKQRKWDGIGYHAVIIESGDIQQGRPPYWQGAHVRGHNGHSLGVCLIGMGGDATAEQLASLKRIIKLWLELNPGAEICGHCDLDSRKPDCPGFDVGDWWKRALAE